MEKMRTCSLIIVLLLSLVTKSQMIQGAVFNKSNGDPIPGATIIYRDSVISVTDNKGRFVIKTGVDTLFVTAIGFDPSRLIPGMNNLSIWLTPIEKELDGIVVSGTMRPVKRSESPIAVEVYTPQFFKKNPAPSLFESLQNVNGVRPQLNCSVCNTGDIHINGLEGPYTMITIDGMPIVSSLASVYGLFGIPTQLIDRVEIVKGPASGLYGSEAIGGLINIITKSPAKAPLFTGSFMTTSWLEHNIDAGFKWKAGKGVQSLLGINYYNYQRPIDNNGDQFTDVTLQHRISIFSKTSFERRQNRVASIAGRYFYEDRWGGETRWNKTFRGSDSIYGESIYTNRWELFGNYQLPMPGKLFFSFSATGHDQNSYYGKIPYRGKQKIVFGQLNWDKTLGPSHNLLMGIATRYNNYDDNSTATIDTLTGVNRPDQYVIPGVYIQDEWRPGPKHLLLAGLRYDRHPVHKSIFTPRFAWKWSLKDKEIFRLNAGTGFRVVSLFTEEHAALTGARAVEIKESLKPERSFNVNANYTRQFTWNGIYLNLDVSAWYSHFTNQIIPDYDTDPNKIIYENLKGYSSSRGTTVNIELNKGNRFKSLVGVTLQDVRKVIKDQQGKATHQQLLLTEKWSGTWSITYLLPAPGITIDYTGNIYGPMRLPLLSPTDPRPANSPVWSIQNIQVTKLISPQWEIFGGVKNLLNWTPTRNTPFIIARAHDPFDKQVQYDSDGKVLATPGNPYALTFDPSYVYAPNQGIRAFIGVRYSVKQ